MSPLIHGAVGWLIAHPAASRRLRITTTIAAVVADIDGIGLLHSEALYMQWHHRLCHGVGFAVVVAVGAAVVCRRERPVLAAVLALLAYHSHIVLDLCGSGPGWPILYTWPWTDNEWLPSWQWDLASWQNSLFGLVTILVCLNAARTVGRTPLEVFSPRADAAVVAAIVGRFERANARNKTKSTNAPSQPRSELARSVSFVPTNETKQRSTNAPSQPQSELARCVSGLRGLLDRADPGGSMRLAALVVALVAFVAVSLWLVHDEGLGGLFILLRTDDWGRQVFLDLCTALTIGWLALAKDARAHGLRLWPWLVATPFVGSPALLGYLIRRELHLRR